MSLNKCIRLCMPFQHVLRSNTCRLYSTRNVLRLRERGMYEDLFPNNSTNEIVELLNSSPQCVYAGFDPTADSLHIGNLLILMNLLHWQRAGHQVIAVLGGATGLIGDPSHRKSERIELEKTALEENLKSIKHNIQIIFQNHEELFWSKDKRKLKPVDIINNYYWYSNVNVIEFMRNIGKYFRMGTMLNKTSVESRLNSETGMSFTEFTYQVFQAYDWLYLLRKFNCRFQIGGSDQMGNITTGHDLISKATNTKVYGMTLPLITSEGGKKFGKSVGNVVWLASNKSSSFQLYQFFMRSKDADVDKLLKLFTFLPLQEITHIVENHFKEPQKREAQRILAEQVTLLVHGEDGLKSAKRASSALYDGSIDSLLNLSALELQEVFEGASRIDLIQEPGLTIYDLAMKVNCFKSERDAERIISSGGFYVNNQRITNMKEVITPGIHILNNNLTLVRVGKKTYHVIRWM